MTELWFTTLDGTRFSGYQIGTYGSWGDLQITTRWGQGACGMFEAQWTMPLPADFEHPALRRGTVVELIRGHRVGSRLVLTSPARGTGIDQPWQLTATGVGREVEGENSFYASDGSGNATTVPTTAVDQARTDGWQVDGRDASVTSTSPASETISEDLNTVGSLLSAAAEAAGKRWLVKNDNMVYFAADPTTPTYQITPGSVALGVADDDYASTVKVRYLDSTTNNYATRAATNAQTAARFGARQYPFDITSRGAMSAAAAQNIADQILALSKGRLAWNNGLTVTSNEILTMGGVPASLSKVLEDVGNGCMVRLNGIWDDLLEFNGQTYLDVIIGEAKWVAGAQTIDLNPLGLAARDLAAVVESVTGMASK